MVQDLLDELDSSKPKELQRLLLCMLSYKLGLRDQDARNLFWNEVIRLTDRRFGVHFSYDKSAHDKGVWKRIPHAATCELHGDTCRHERFISRPGTGRGAEHCVGCLMEEWRQHENNAERVKAGKNVFVSECHDMQYPMEPLEQCQILREVAGRLAFEVS